MTPGGRVSPGVHRKVARRSAKTRSSCGAAFHVPHNDRVIALHDARCDGAFHRSQRVIEQRHAGGAARKSDTVETIAFFARKATRQRFLCRGEDVDGGNCEQWVLRFKTIEDVAIEFAEPLEAP